MIYKFSNIFMVTFGILFSTAVFGQNNTSASTALQAADSLFANKKYTEALTAYQSVYEQDKATPAMLLKMSFIHEGLDQIVESLYYLNQYYQLTADRDAIQKITELAAANELEGYVYTDAVYLLNYFYRYRQPILWALAALLLLSVVFLWRKKQQKEPWTPALVFQIIFTFALFVLSNQLLETEKAIIKSNNTVLMTGPAAGAEPITVLEKGHRVVILESSAIWTKINWNNTVGYVRNNRILPI